MAGVLTKRKILFFTLKISSPSTWAIMKLFCWLNMRVLFWDHKQRHLRHTITKFNGITKPLENIWKSYCCVIAAYRNFTIAYRRVLSPIFVWYSRWLSYHCVPLGNAAYRDFTIAYCRVLFLIFVQYSRHSFNPCVSLRNTAYRWVYLIFISVPLFPTFYLCWQLRHPCVLLRIVACRCAS